MPHQLNLAGWLGGGQSLATTNPSSLGADAVGDREGSLAARSTKPPARPGSIASTYWRDERTDRKKLLNVIDER